MSDLKFLDNLEAERLDLKLHVDLCAQRYNQLINKFDEVDEQLLQLTMLCSEIKDSITHLKSTTQLTYLRWAGFIIVTLLGVVIHYAVK